MKKMSKLTSMLKIARLQAGVSQHELSEKINYHIQTYSRIENDFYYFMHMPLCKFLKLCFLLDGSFKDEVLTKEFLKKLLTDYENNEYNTETK